MKSAVTISLVTEAKGGPFVFWDGLADGCRRAAALGFDAVEIFPPSAAAVDAGELKELLTRYNLGLAALGTGAGWVLHKWSLSAADPAIRSRARSFIRELIDLASSFNAPAVVGTIQGRCENDALRPQALAWLGEALNELGEHAAARGQTLLLEPLNRYETNLLNQVAEAARLLERIPAANVRILADLFHMSIEEASVPEALRGLGSRLGHLHFSDSNRRAMGFGHTDPGPIIETLRRMGYAGYLSAEILPVPDSETAARQALRSFRRYLT